MWNSNSMKRFFAGISKTQSRIFRSTAFRLNKLRMRFFNPEFKLIDAERNAEARDALLGIDQIGHLLFVVLIEFEESHIRIISARNATAKERETYDGDS